MFSRTFLESLKARVDPVDVLTYFGGVSIQDLEESREEVRCACPIHNGDNPSAFAWNKNKKFWKCFTNDCGENLKKDSITFVRLVKKVSFEDAVLMLAEFYGMSPEYMTEENKDALRALNTVKKINSLTGYLPEKEEVYSKLPYYAPDYLYLVEQYLKNVRGFNLEDIADFNLYPCVDVNKVPRLGIPHYNIKNEIVGINTRSLDGVYNYPEKTLRYRNLSKFKKSNSLYAGNIVFNSKERHKIYLVEGELSCIRMHSYGYKGTLAYSGSSLSSVQSAILASYTNSVTLIIEDNQAAIKGAYKNLKILFDVGIIRVGLAFLPEGDPDSCPKNTLVDILESVKYQSLPKLIELKPEDFLKIAEEKNG